jgi:hypothetical protein
MMKAILLYKAAIPYLCVPALIGTAVVTHTNHKAISRQIAKVHRPAPVRKPPLRAAYKPTARTGIETTALTVPLITEPTAPVCITYGGGLSGGGGGSGGIGIGGGYIGGVGTTLPPVSTPGTVSPVPEPSAWALSIIGFALIGGAMRSNRKRLPKEE